MKYFLHLKRKKKKKIRRLESWFDQSTTGRVKDQKQPNDVDKLLSRGKG